MISVLYVDDEPHLLEIGKIFLESPGELTVETAASARQVLEAGDLSRYDAIVSDYQMPVTDGIAFLKEVRSRYGSIPFILFTGKGREEVVIQAINEGADFYLQKGGDPKAQFAELRHKIRIAVERCRAVARVEESERRLLDIINFLPDATFAIDREGRIIAWNRAIEEMTGVPAAGILGKGDHEYAIPIYGQRKPMLIDLVVTGDPAIAALYPSLKRAGQTLFAEAASPFLNQGKGATIWFTAAPLYDTHGTLVGAIESIRDITERKQAEDALRTSEERYRNVVEDQTEFISRFLPDGTHVFVNDAYCRYFGLDRSAIIGHRFQPMIHPEDARQVRAFFASLTPENPVGSIEHRIIMPDGNVRWQRWSDRAIFDASGRLVEYQSVGRDTTEWKEAEIRVQESEKRFSEIIEFAPNATFVIDRDGRIIVWNRAIEEMTGMPASAMLGKGGHAYAVPFYGETRPTLIDLVFTESPERSPLYRDLRREGNTIIAESYCPALYGSRGAWVFVKASPLRDAAGRVVGAIESIRDISDIKNAGIALEKKNEELRAALARLTLQEEELRKKYDELAVSRSLLAAGEERYRTLAEASQDFIFVVGRDNRIEYVNSHAAALLNLPADQIIGKEQSSLFPPDLAIRQAKALQRVFDTGKAARSEGAMEINGSTRWFDHSLMPITGPDGTVISVLGVSRDISDRKQIETSLREIGERYRALFDAMHDCVAVYRAVDGGKDFEVIEFNTAAERTEQIPRDRVIGRKVTGVFPGVEEFGILSVLRRVWESGVPEDFPLSLYRDNRLSGWRENYVYRLPGGEVVASYRDETERKLAGEALKASEERFRHISSITTDFAFSCREEPGSGYAIDWLGGAVTAITGYSEDDLKQLRCWRAIVLEDDLPVFDRDVTGLDPGATATCELRILRRDGTLRWLSCRTQCRIEGGDPPIPRLYGGCQDITGRKQTEESLREIGEQYRSIFESVSDGLIIFNREGRIVEANPAACAMHGYSCGEMIGLSGPDIIHPRFHARFAEFLKTGPDEIFSEKPLDVRRDGSVFPLAVRGRVFDFHGAPHILAVITDLTGIGKDGVPGHGKRGEPALITTDSAPL